MEYRIFEDPSDVSDFMPCKLKWNEHWTDEWLFWSSSPDDELQYQQRKFTAVAPISRHYNKLLRGKYALPYLRNRFCSDDVHCLTQIWVAVNGKGSKFLSIADQYFALTSGFDERLCEYRRICLNTLIPVDANSGFEGLFERGFKSGLVEFSPDLQREESSLHQHAIRLGIRQNWVCPFIHNGTPSGLVEFALLGSTSFTFFHFSLLLEIPDSFKIGQPLSGVQPLQDGRETAETDSWPDWSNFLNWEDDVTAAQHIPSCSVQPNVEIDSTSSADKVEHNDITRCFPTNEAEAIDRDSSFINGAMADIHKKNENLLRIENDHGITREKLEENYGKSRKEAAQYLNVSVATLKRTCREYGITRWPHYKTRKVTPRVSRTVSLQGVTPSVGDQECPNLSQENGGTGYDAHKRSPANGKTCDSVMFAKVTYGGFIIKFKLSASSTKEELAGQVEKGFNISPQRFSIEYQDGDDDWILITCDSHLRDGMDELRSLGKSTMKFRVTQC